MGKRLLLGKRHRRRNRWRRRGTSRSAGDRREGKQSTDPERGILKRHIIKLELGFVKKNARLKHVIEAVRKHSY